MIDNEDDMILSITGKQPDDKVSDEVNSSDEGGIERINDEVSGSEQDESIIRQETSS